ncbi:probable 60s ribosomal protein L7 subunit [Sporisorium reilianum f. sp. reilianum]|uniref:Probable 60s ribosomal protein L7 subunit n=1 Tax=Sporisorium reilianum f. sp. reilianum TaxID=72559 RepID=A0A2N8UGH9_9BASI|nr:probable 60s ribosomal protein L7 subunit [Sporisorium reilianum f. sp. reilianum]
MSAQIRTTVPSAHDVLVPETLLKKRKSDAKAREEKAAKAAESKKANLAKRKVVFKRAEQYTKEYRTAEREEIRLRRAAKAKGDFYVAGQPKVVFVVRLRGINNIAPKPRKILQLLRLLQINNGVFVRLTKATSQMLQLVQPYVTYGAPNLKTIRELVYKRGYAKVNRQRLPINDNKIIEDNLGKYGILSIEDIVHEIATCGPNFKAVTNFLWAFKLSNPNGGFKGKKLTHYTEGGNTGDRGEAINALVRRMN